MLIDPHLADSRILVCDDSPSHAMMLKSLLESEGVRKVDKVTDPRRVLPTLSGHGNFDLLLLDLEMPHLHGFEVLELLRSELSEEEQIPVIVITGVAAEDIRLRALELGASDFISKPFNQTEVVLRVRNTLRLRDALVRQRQINRDLEARVRERTAELERATDAFVLKLSQISEPPALGKANSSSLVGRLAGMLSELVGMPAEQRFLIERAAPLHDVGNAVIPDEILLKPGKLDANELALVRRHPELGRRLLYKRDAALFEMAASIAASHHERWDGTGYPNGLRGDEIPIEGRITAICDVFDALISRRPYKDPWSVQNAVEYLVSQSGHQFDPKLVELFVKFLDRVEEIREGVAA